MELVIGIYFSFLPTLIFILFHYHCTHPFFYIILPVFRSIFIILKILSKLFLLLLCNPFHSSPWRSQPTTITTLLRVQSTRISPSLTLIFSPSSITKINSISNFWEIKILLLLIWTLRRIRMRLKMVKQQVLLLTIFQIRIKISNIFISFLISAMLILNRSMTLALSLLKDLRRLRKV